MTGLALCLLAGLGVVVWSAVREDPYVASPGRPAASAAPAAAAETLRDLERALADGDPAAAAALAPPGDDAAARALRGIAATARAARVTEVSMRYVTELDGVDRSGGWVAAVDVGWAFAGFDASAALAEVRMAFREQDGRVYVAGVGGGPDRRTPVWLSGPLEVRRSAQALVLVRGTAREADRLATLARRAVPVVRRVLPEVDLRLVVEVPASAADLDRALDADPGSYARIAAVTTSVDGSQNPDAPVHVFVNPEVFGGLRGTGAQVVMSHEAVHVATGAATGAQDLPTWLLEGFADYVALRDVPLPLSVTAGQVVARVRREGAPARLPGPEAFDSRRPGLGASYEAAWLACRLLAQLRGEDTLVRFYRRVDAGVPLARALRTDYGFDVAELTRRWRALLTDLAA